MNRRNGKQAPATLLHTIAGADSDIEPPTSDRYCLSTSHHFDNRADERPG